MPDYKSLTHTRWDCKYHVVFIPKKRQKVIYGICGRFWVKSSTNWQVGRFLKYWKRPEGE
jgi:REP element-mobilizing transposase RayT